ncbi:MAG: TrfA family protein, partial [bacterium]|nr:TrfA family protein [bacterium]
PLAKHLQLWLSSHDKPYPVTVQYLHDITGSNTKELKYFRRNLKAALNRLIEVGILADWRIDERDKVHFVKA